MKLNIHRRAEVSRRFLGQVEQERIDGALADLAATEQKVVFKNHRLRRVPTKDSAESFYAYRVSPELRAILSLQDDKWTVEDIVHRDLVNRLLRERVHR